MGFANGFKKFSDIIDKICLGVIVAMLGVMVCNHSADYLPYCGQCIAVERGSKPLSVNLVYFSGCQLCI